jgi:hypothetical protein
VVRHVDRFLPFPHLSWIAVLQANPQADTVSSASAATAQDMFRRESGYSR